MNEIERAHSLARMKQREAKRRFWTALMARYEGSGKSRKDFATETGVGLAIFQYWVYKLRRERGAKVGRTAGSRRSV